MVFIDTNYFLRYLLEDNPKQSREAKQLFIDASDGKKQLMTSTIVLFEVYWVLKSFYQVEKPVIIASLEDILKLKFIIIEERNIIRKALDNFVKQNLSLEDCYNLVFAKAKAAKEFRTFDIKLAKEFNKR